MPSEEPIPSVRVDVGAADPASPSPAPSVRATDTRSWMQLGLLAVLAIVVASLVLALDLLTEASEPEAALDEATAVPLDEQDPATNAALALAIDAFDRITYTTTSPALDSIHRVGDTWYTIDSGLLHRSTDLISWVVTSNLWEVRALALDSSPGEPILLYEAEQELIISPVDGVPSSGITLSGEAIMGALRFPQWAVVELDSDGYWLSIGAGVDIHHRTALGSPPASLAIANGFVLATFDNDEDASLFSFPTSGDASGQPWCNATIEPSRLITAGDGVVHLVGDTTVSVVEGSSAVVAVDSTSVDPLSESSTAPLATGRGWSVTTGIGTDQPTVWTTTDGLTFERIGVPRTKGAPVRVVWAYLDASQGVGVHVSDVAATNGLLRVGDPRTRHPRPQDLNRSITVEHVPITTSLRATAATCGEDSAAKLSRTISVNRISARGE